MVLPIRENTHSAPNQSPKVNGSDLLTFAFEHSNTYDVTKPIYIDAENPERALSASQTKLLVRKFIGGWKAAGLKDGDCVLVVLANNFLYPAIYFSIIGAGGVYLGVNPASQAFEIEHSVKLCDPKFIITSQDVLPRVSQALQSSQATSSSFEQLFLLDSKTFPLRLAPPSSAADQQLQNGAPELNSIYTYTDLTELLDHEESDWIRFDDESTARSTPAAMFQTSGTSGLPKAAISSHFALVNQHLSMEHKEEYEVSRLISLPFFHLFAAMFAHIFPIRLGQPLYILPRFQPEQFTNAVQRFKITDTVMAPPIVHTLNKSSLNLEHLLDSIRWIGVGGAPIAAEAMQKFRTFLNPSATLSQVWGMTEIGVSMLVRHPEQNCDGSIGRPLPGYETRLLDSFGGIVTSDNEPGELHIRYHAMMSGYKDQEPHNPNDWYATGDIMTRAEGKFYVVGRSKELIKVNGWQVPPAELEAVLMSHTCIEDAGVIGVLRDDGVTEVPRAYVVRKPDANGRCSSLSAESIYQYTRERLATYKALSGGIFFVDFIPRTASGKIQRFKLAQMDQYRHSVTELLVQNSSIVAEQKRDKIVDLKTQAEQRRIATRRSSRIASIQYDPTEALNANVASACMKNKTRRRSKNSLIEKLKALEASRLVFSGAESVSALSS